MFIFERKSCFRNRKLIISNQRDFFLSPFISPQIDQENAKIMQIINSERYGDS